MPGGNFSNVGHVFRHVWNNKNLLVVDLFFACLNLKWPMYIEENAVPLILKQFSAVLNH